MTQKEREQLVERIRQIMAFLEDDELVVILNMVRALLKP